MKKPGIKVLLVWANSFMDNLIPLGISYLSAFLKQAKHEVRLFDTTFYRTSGKTGDEVRAQTLQVQPTNLADLGIFPENVDLVLSFKKMVREFKPDLIGVSVVEPTYLIGLRLLDAIKGWGIPTIMGGIHVTFSADEVINHPAVDMVCIGEGEKALVELANRMRDKRNHKDIPNIWVKDGERIYKNPPGPLVDLDDLPQQDWEIYEDRRFYRPMGGKISRTGPFEMNRGCPYDCTFCCNMGLQMTYKEHGAYYRQQKMSILMNEIKIKVSRFRLQYLFFVAENFLLMSEDRFSEFIQRYREIKLPFWIQTRPDSVTEKKMQELRAVGCEGVSIGVEHGNDEFRKRVLNKNISNDVIIEAFHIANKAGVRTSANNIIGFPTETRKLVFDTIELNRKINADNVIVNIFTPYRGTRLRQISIEKGYLDPSAIAGDYRLDASLVMPHFPPQRIKGLQRTFSMYVKFPKVKWPKIEKCERFNREGNKAFVELRKEYLKNYM